MSRAGSGRPTGDAQSDPLRGAARPVAFGKYQLFATLGRGGMSDVYLAVARGPMGFNKLVVVKRLRTALSEEPSFLQMFLDEARLAARLNHPNVVHTYEVGEEDGSYFIAMEYLEGQPLNQIVRALTKRGERIDPAMAAKIVADALAGLAYAHQLEDYDGTPLAIIHRDVSPHNVFVTYDGQVKLVDFGIAKAALSQSQTDVGVLKGKVAYMAPEQATAGAIDQRADLFAMGIVLWELLTRQKLFQGDTVAATLHRLLNGSIAKLSVVVPTIDPGLEAIVAKALEKEPEARYQTAIEMRDALEAWLRSSAAAVSDTEIGERVSELFDDVRSEVRLQVQKAMEAIAHGDAPVLDLRSTSDSLLRASTRLPSLRDSQSGSGIVAPRDLPASGRAAGDDDGRRGTVAIFLGLLLVALAGVIVVMFRVVVGGPAPAGSAPAASEAAPARVEPPPPAASSAPLATTSAVAETPSASATASAPRATASTPPQSSAPPPPSPAADNGAGYLTFDTYPWSQVSEAGRTLGTTPLVHVSMPPGVHTLSLENSEQGIHRTYSVAIKTGETFTMRLGIAEP